MGVEGIEDLAAREHDGHVDAASLSQEQANQDAAQERRTIVQRDAQVAAEDQEIVYTRAEVEQKFAEARDEIEAKYAAKVAKAEEERDKQLSKNIEKRQDALGKVGLNPDGSNPRDRPQAVVDRQSRRVVEASV